MTIFVTLIKLNTPQIDLTRYWPSIWNVDSRVPDHNATLSG